MSEVSVKVRRARKRVALDRNIHCDRKGGSGCGTRQEGGAVGSGNIRESGVC